MIARTFAGVSLFTTLHFFEWVETCGEAQRQFAGLFRADIGETTLSLEAAVTLELP
jgi:hypothetical protein